MSGINIKKTFTKWHFKDIAVKIRILNSMYAFFKDNSIHPPTLGIIGIKANWYLFLREENHYSMDTFL